MNRFLLVVLFSVCIPCLVVADITPGGGDNVPLPAITCATPGVPVYSSLVGECSAHGTSAPCWFCNFCGDGIPVVSGGQNEDCDDGNINETDGCRHCRLPECGDGIMDAGESCDTDDFSVDAGIQPGPAGATCSATCTINPYCGDGLRNSAEPCDGLDYGLSAGVQAGSAGHVCVSCVDLFCGDGLKNTASEICDGDDFGDAAGTQPGPTGATCNVSCTINPYCGDGRMNTGESCDGSDFDLAADVQAGPVGATCSATCTINPYCGDGRMNTGESCDGSDFDLAADVQAGPVGATCSATCTINLYCGDGVMNAGESCDGSDFDLAVGTQAGPTGAVCSAVCEINPYCGDGFRNASEICDGTDYDLAAGVQPGLAGHTCINCIDIYCGDGLRNGSEVCDGNDFGTLPDVQPGPAGATCSSLCTVNPYCGDSIPGNVAGETCDDGNLIDNDVCRNNCTRCGDGVMQAAEQCDGLDFRRDAGTQTRDNTTTCTSSCTVNTNCPAGVPMVCGFNANAIDWSPGNFGMYGTTGCSRAVLNNINYCIVHGFSQYINGDPANACYCPVTTFCGDGVVQSGEECDLGVVNGDLGATCTLNCKNVTCPALADVAKPDCTAWADDWREDFGNDYGIPSNNPYYCIRNPYQVVFPNSFKPVIGSLGSEYIGGAGEDLQAASNRFGVTQFGYYVEYDDDDENEVGLYDNMAGWINSLYPIGQISLNTCYFCTCVRIHGCFSPDTKILMSDGSMKKIADIRRGEMVWNPVRQQAYPVEQILESGEEYPLIEVGYDAIRLKVSQAHPMVRAEDGRIVNVSVNPVNEKEYDVIKASDLRLGDRILGADSEYHAITVLRSLPVAEGQTVVNFVINSAGLEYADHLVVADGVITGDLVAQKMIPVKEK